MNSKRTLAILTVFVFGACLRLVSFLQLAVAVIIADGVDKLSGYTPGNFWWWILVPGYLLMTLCLGMTLRNATKTGISRGISRTAS